jgi:ABC-type amino acid transport substrate-binding protein
VTPVETVAVTVAAVAGVGRLLTLTSNSGNNSSVRVRRASSNDAAAALMLGAKGALMGTRFYAATEALGHERAKKRIVTATGSETRRTRVFDVVRDPENPAGFSPVYSGIGILKADAELTEAIRLTLQALIDEGTYQQVLERNNIAAYAVDSAEVNQGAAS